MAKQFAVVIDHPHVQIGHQHDDVLASETPANADVVQFASVTECDRPRVVDAVVAHASLGQELLTGERRRGLVESSPRVHRGTRSCLMRSHLVVVVNEAVDLVLQLFDA